MAADVIPPAFRPFVPLTTTGPVGQRCHWCGARLRMTRKDKRWCSPTCHNRFASQARAMRRRGANFDRRCVWCGGAIPLDRRRDAVTCSRTCNTRLQNKRGWERRKQQRQAATVVATA